MIVVNVLVKWTYGDYIPVYTHGKVVITMANKTAIYRGICVGNMES